MNTINLFSLQDLKETVRELLKENNQLLLQNLRAQDDNQEPPRDLIDVTEAARITGYTKSTLYSKVCRMEIPVVNKGRPLTFSRKEITEWLYGGRPNWSDQQAEKYFNK